MDIHKFLEYEVKSSWIAKFIWFKWGQELLGLYFAKKTEIKYNRFIKANEIEAKLKIQ